MNPKLPIYLSPPHMEGCELDNITQAFRSNWVAPLGPYVDRFESEFAYAVGAKHALALSSGTAALHLALLVLGVKPGDTVITSTLTFIATANAIRYVGANPVFIDCSADTWNMDPHLLAQELHDRYGRGERVAAVMPVDLYGRSADYDAINAICAQYDIPVIQDAAEALGSTYQGKPSGSSGCMAAFSFNGNKIITTSGGGMLVSDQARWIEKARYLATQARLPQPHYEHEDIGYNYRMSNLLAAVGCAQLAVLPKRVSRRRTIHQQYKNLLKDISGVTVASHHDDGESNCWLTCIEINHPLFGGSPEMLRRFMLDWQVECRPVWKPMHMQPVFRGCEVRGGEVSESIFNRSLCLPSGSSLLDEDQEYITEKIRDFHRLQLGL